MDNLHGVLQNVVTRFLEASARQKKADAWIQFVSAAIASCNFDADIVDLLPDECCEGFARFGDKMLKQYKSRFGE